MASVKQSIERRNNIAAIIGYVRERGSATRMEISAALSLSWACVSDNVSALISDGILFETSQRTDASVSESRGRTPTYLSLSDKKYFLGVDINNSGIAVAVLGVDGRLVRSRKWEAERFSTCEELSRSVCEKIESISEDREMCLGIGVAMSGRHAPDGSWGYPSIGGMMSYRPKPVIVHPR